MLWMRHAGAACSWLSPYGNWFVSDGSLTAGAHAEPSVTVSVGASDGVHGVAYNRSYTVTDNSPITGEKLVVYTVTWNDNGAHSVSLISRIGNGLL